MKRLGRSAAILVILSALLPLTTTALAQEEPSSTTVAEEPVATVDVEPAVPVTTAPANEPTPDWTYRYLIPTGLVLAALIIVVTCIQYFTRVVRKRYRIVQE